MNRATMFIPGALLGLGVLLISGMREQHAVPPASALTQIARSIDGKAGRDLIVGAEEAKIAGMSEYVMREFDLDSNTSLSVYVGYYDRQVQGKTIHSPKNCLPGAGWEIMSSTEIPAPGSHDVSNTINAVILANNQSRALVYYWYQGRGRLESNEYRVKWNLLRDAMLYGRTEESLVRIVIPITSSIGAGALDLESPAMAKVKGLADAVAKRLISDVSTAMPTMPVSR